MPKMPMPILTASYRTWRPEHGVPVRITVGRPKAGYFPHGYEELLTLAPWELFSGGRYVEQPLEDELRVYRHRLHSRQTRLLAEMNVLAERVDGMGIVLCCYENVWAGEICHRRWFAEWAREKWGWDVLEVGKDGGAPGWPEEAPQKAPLEEKDPEFDPEATLF